MGVTCAEGMPVLILQRQLDDAALDYEYPGFLKYACLRAEKSAIHIEQMNDHGQ
jgi:hypothetical protein